MNDDYDSFPDMDNEDNEGNYDFRVCEGRAFSDPDGQDTTNRDRFHIDSDAKADWAVRKIGEEKAEFERLKELAELNISRLKGKLEREKERFERNTAYLTGLLEEYFDTVPENQLKKSPTQESYKLLYGKLIRKHPGPEIDYKEDELVKFLKATAPDYIKTEEKPMWGEYKKTLKFTAAGAITKDGEIVPCITITPGMAKFEVKPDKM